jgi:hypothetical protein
MIQRPTSGTFDLELCKPTRAGEKSFAVTASEFFQHLQCLLISARLRPARASSEGLGWLAGWFCDLAAPLGVTAPSGVALSFFAATQKPRTYRGFLVSEGHKKTRLAGRVFVHLAKGKILTMEK